VQYGNVPGIDKQVSRIVLGSMVIQADDRDRAHAVLDAAYAAGINTIDTGRVYGTAEPTLGAWVTDRGLRDEVVILSKGCHPSQYRRRVTPFDLASDLYESLAALGLDYIDLYMFHRDDPEVPVGPLVEAFNEHLSAGRVRAFGASNWTFERIGEANEYAASHGLVPFAATSPYYGLAEQVEDPWPGRCASLSGPANAAARDWCRQNDIAVFAYSSLARGLFSGRVTRENYRDEADRFCIKAYCHGVNFDRLDRALTLAEDKGVTVAQVALAYLFCGPLNVFPLVGAQSRDECESCAGALDVALTPQELAWLDLRSDER